MAEAKAISTRKKIAAAILALSAGVIGTGFAAGTITLNDGGQAFGSGFVSTNDVDGPADITGTLTIQHPISTVMVQQGKAPEARMGANYEISGWENVPDAVGGTYEVHGVLLGGSAPQKIAEGTVTEGMAPIDIPSTVSGKSVQEIHVLVTK